MDIEFEGEEQICPRDRISNLPDEILMDHVFCHFNLRQSCTTSCVSRKFYRLLSTNPVIDIDLNESGYPSEAFQVIIHIMNRYAINDVPIRKFKLKIELDEDIGRYFGSDIESWIETAVTNQVEILDVSIDPHKEPPNHDEKDFLLRAGIVLSSKSLKVLKLSNLEIYCAKNDYGEVNLGCLEVLELYSVVCKNHVLVNHILSSSPIICLDISGCFISNINVTQPKTRKVVIWQESVLPGDVLGSINLHARGVEEFCYHGGWDGKPDCPVRINFPEELVNLRTLTIVSAAIRDEMVNSIIPMLPVLQYLELRKCYCLKNTTISSSSLKKLNLGSCENLEVVQIDAVNLEMFWFCGILEGNFQQVLFLSKCSAYCKATWEHRSFYCGLTKTLHFTKLKDFLVKSSVFSELTLRFSPPEAEVEFNLDDVTEYLQGPAYKLRHLNLCIQCYPKESDLSSLLEGVLWSLLPARWTYPPYTSYDPKMYKIIMEKISKCAKSEDHPLKGVEVKFKGSTSIHLNLNW